LFDWNSFINDISRIYSKLSQRQKEKLHKAIDVMEQYDDESILNKWKETIFKNLVKE